MYAGSPGPHLLQAVTLNRYSFPSITSVIVCSRSRTPVATFRKYHHNCQTGMRVKSLEETTRILTDLGPSLARHFSFFNLVVSDGTSSIVFWSFPHHVNMTSRHLSHLKVSGSTGASLKRTNQTWSLYLCFMHLSQEF